MHICGVDISYEESIDLTKFHATDTVMFSGAINESGGFASTDPRASSIPFGLNVSALFRLFDRGDPAMIYNYILHGILILAVHLIQTVRFLALSHRLPTLSLPTIQSVVGITPDEWGSLIGNLLRDFLSQMYI